MSSRRQFIQQLVWGGAGFIAAQYPESSYAKDDFVQITILHTNDMHCHIEPFPKSDPLNGGKGGMTHLSGIIEKIRAESPAVFLFDAGDMFQGTPYFNYYRGELVLKIMSQMGYDAGTIGNHEFDNGLEGIGEALPFARFPLLSSNYDFSDTELNGSVANYKTFRKEGIKIGLYALGVELDGLVAKKNFQGTRYLDPLTIARKMELFLKEEKKCDLVVCLSHLGLEYEEKKVSDKIIAGETHCTDLIIGGHTHTFLDDAIRMKNAAGKQVMVNQVGYGALMLGRIDFMFDRNRKVQTTVSASLKNG
ncbi:MAG: metallophosphatase [Prolixibacteraceae bacterium]|jgi:5'-nucleotidase|nr:metallophosphatase [Prolixibacteraceae bacterium]